MTDFSSEQNPHARGYWAGLKDLKKLGRPFWLAIVLIIMWQLAQGAIDNVYFRGGANSLGETLRLLIGIGTFASLILFGSVFDWLGMRRMLYILIAGALIYYGAGYVFWLAHGPFDPWSWALFQRSDSVFSGLFVVFDYMLIKRFCVRSVRPQAVVINDLLPVAVSFVALFSVLELFFFPRSEAEYTATFAFPVALAALAVAAMIAWNIDEKRQAGKEISPADEKATRPVGPFSGWRDVYKSPVFGKLLLLYVVEFLVGYAESGQFSVWKTFANPESVEQVKLSIYTSMGGGIVFIAPLLILPAINRIDIAKLMKICAFALVFGVLLLAIPIGDRSIMLIVSVAATMLTGGAYMLFSTGYMIYVVNAMPAGREGSTLALLGIVGVFTRLAKYGMDHLIDSQREAGWVHAIVDAINPAASAAHPLWLIVLVPVLLGTVLLVRYRAYLFNSPGLLQETDRN